MMHTVLWSLTSLICGASDVLCRFMLAGTCRNEMRSVCKVRMLGMRIPLTLGDGI